MIKVNMMCGKRNWNSAGWVSIDKVKLGHIWSDNICLNNLPINSVDLLYCSHGIAYFDRSEMISLLKIYWFPVIAPGGTIRLATPDIEIISKFLQVGLDLDRVLGPLYGKMELNDEDIYHKTTYDFISLKTLLEQAGFLDVRRYDHTKTEHPNTGDFNDFYDDHSCAYINGTLISLNVEATKPI